MSSTPRCSHTAIESARSCFQPHDLQRMQYDRGPAADARFAAWAAGRTGFPLVDAGMRQLLREGWMHNRVRMVVASFLVKDLHLDWTRGARHFMIEPDGRRPGVEPARLAVGRRHGHRRGAVLPGLQPGEPRPDGSIRTATTSVDGCPSCHTCRARRSTSRGGAPRGCRSTTPSRIVEHSEERAESLARYRRVPCTSQRNPGLSALNREEASARRTGRARCSCSVRRGTSGGGSCRSCSTPDTRCGC